LTLLSPIAVSFFVRGLFLLQGLTQQLRRIAIAKQFCIGTQASIGGDEGRMPFNALQAGRGWLHYVAFDLLWLNGRDMRAQPLTRRKRRLEGLIPTNNATLSRVLAVEEHGRELFEAVQRLDLEGIVAKRKRDAYSRQTIWYKIKNPAYTQAEGRGELFYKPR
jgi:bifunctional non-homologous end joining protein LigD